jgi:hypothetical protein
MLQAYPQSRRLSVRCETIQRGDRPKRNSPIWLTSNSPNESCFPCRPSWKTSFCVAKAEHGQIIDAQDLTLRITDFEMGVGSEVDHTL